MSKPDLMKLRKAVLRTEKLWQISCKREYKTWKGRKEDWMKFELGEKQDFLTRRDIQNVSTAQLETQQLSILLVLKPAV